MATLSLAAVLSAQGQILANFEQGNGSSSPDQYIGKAGDGWSSPWSPIGKTGLTYTNSVVDTAPLAEGGNYLSVSIANTGASANSGAVVRQFDSSVVSVTAPVQFSLNFRAETTSSAGTYYYITNSIGTAYAGTNSGNTWSITYTGGNYWRVQNGSATYTTSMAFTAGDVYNFVITSDPATYSYSITINNLTSSASWSSQGVTTLSYRNQTGNSDGTTLTFSAQAAAGGTADFAVDSLKIQPVPEPGVAALVGVGLLVLAFKKKAE